MICPIDQTTLSITERQGIELDYCPTCRGVWLDRGELDKIIDRQNSQSASSRDSDDRERHERSDRSEYHDGDRDRDYDERRRDDNHGDHHKKSKKEGFLGELFDFG
jgi:Zn-finger nucleic acid-binding protein